MRSVRVLAAAPPVLDRRIAGTEEGRERGMVVQLRRGPEVVFGDLSRLDVKWSAAIRVLADPASRGASYVDVRLPDRPAAGGLGEAESPPEPAAAATGQAAGAAPPGAAGAGASGAASPGGTQAPAPSGDGADGTP